MSVTGYPKEMRHPAFVPAVVSGYHRLPGNKVKDDPPGRPMRFPPVWVNNDDQEQYYASLGYVPVGVADAEAYRRATIGEDRAGPYKHQDFPCWLYAPLVSGEVQSALVHNEDELKVLSGNWSKDLAEVKIKAAEMKETEAAKKQREAELLLEAAERAREKEIAAAEALVAAPVEATKPAAKRRQPAKQARG